MQILTKSRHTEVAEDLREYAREKVETKCSHYLNPDDPSIIGEIEFDDLLGPKGGVDKQVDITLALPHQHLPVKIVEVDTDFRQAIDKAVDRLDQPLAKYKESKR